VNGSPPSFGRHLHVVTRIYVTPRNHAIDLGDDRAITAIKVGVIEIALRLRQLRFGLRSAVREL
jgi:hypothetical protein